MEHKYPLKITIVKGDITKVEADAIVNAANRFFYRGQGVDGAIHNAAGRELAAELADLRKKIYLNGLPIGEVAVTKAYALAAKHIFHVVAPTFHKDDTVLLTKCYQNILAKAEELKLKSIAIPAIGTGAHKVPIEVSAKIACDIIKRHKTNTLETVYVILFNSRDFEVYLRIFNERI